VNNGHKHRNWMATSLAALVGGIVGVEIYTVVDLELPSVFDGGPFLWGFLVTPAMIAGLWAGIVSAVVLGLISIAWSRVARLALRLAFVVAGSILGAVLACLTTFFLADSWVYIICVAATVAIATALVTVRNFAGTVDRPVGESA
jgi:hypothetical protein